MASIANKLDMVNTKRSIQKQDNAVNNEKSIHKQEMIKNDTSIDKKDNAVNMDQLSSTNTNRLVSLLRTETKCRKRYKLLILVSVGVDRFYQRETIRWNTLYNMQTVMCQFLSYWATSPLPLLVRTSYPITQI